MVPASQNAQFMTAITAWARWCVRQRRPYHHPNAQQSTIGRQYVHLRDGRGNLLARYELATGQILRR